MTAYVLQVFFTLLYPICLSSDIFITSVTLNRRSGSAESERRTYGLVLLKMKNALPSGMGGVFSFMVSSESRWARDPGGASGRFSLSSSSLSPIKQLFSIKNSVYCL